MRGEREAAADVKRADAFRRVELVSGEGHGIGAEGLDVDIDPAGGLHGVAVQVNPALARHARDLGHRLEDARLVVGQHHGHELRLGTDGCDHRLGLHAAAAVRIDGRDVAAAQHFGHGGVLDRRCDNVGTFRRGEDSVQSGVVRLRAAAREDDVAGGGPDQARHRLPRFLDQTPRRLALFMNAGSIAIDVPQRRAERVEHLRVQSRRGVVVEIDSHSKTRFPEG